MADPDPRTNAEARLRQIRDEIDALLDGESARTIDGRSAGTVDDITGIVFGIYGDVADVRATQEAVDEPPAPQFCLLGEFLEGLSAATGHPPMHIAKHAVDVMEASKDSDEYSRSASFTAEE